ncbi:MAG TPA: class I SAM-dependent methyltransferase [bacterium]|nr:class I SAM-dependent methyltransferase [bacterium]
MKKLAELLKEYRADFGGTLIQNTLPGLYDLIQYVHKNKPNVMSTGSNISVLEIGSFEGVSTELFAMTCQSVHAVDGWDLAVTENNYDGIPKERLIQAEKVFRDKMRSYANVILAKCLSSTAHVHFDDNMYDLVYIDADHKEKAVYDDIMNWKSKVREGGFIAGHDYSNIYTVRNAVDSAFGKPDKVFSDCSWIKKCT